MDLATLQSTLARIPEPAVPAVDDELIAASLLYLRSMEASQSLRYDPYWPKWDSPWWHLLLLYELGVIDRVVGGGNLVAASLDRMPIHVFPITPKERPPGTDPQRDSACHCAIGCMVPVLRALRVDVARALPWAEEWLTDPRYVLPDGGLNCDETAYMSGEPDASSMVATIAPFEATLAERSSLVADRAAFLIARKLTLGSASTHNAAEREAARAWPLLTFPRFYFYDVLRGLTALVRWADLHGRELPLAVIAPIVERLAADFPDGAVRIGRRARDVHPQTLAFVDGAWGRHPTSSFPLLDAVSQVGAASPALTREWAATRRTLLSLADRGLLS